MSMTRDSAGPARLLAGAARDALLDRCIAGDTAAWRELHARYHRVALNFLRHLGVHELDLDDAVQEVFVQVFRYLPRFKGESDFKSWMYRLCLTQASRLHRRRLLLGKWKRLFGWQRPAGLVPDGPSLDAREERGQVQRALEQLSPLLRRTFVLYELEGLSGEQIATIERCPITTVWRRLHDARKRFERFITENARGEP